MGMQVRTSSLIGARELLIGYDVIPEQVFTEVGIDQQWVSEPGLWMPYQKFLQFLHRSAELTRDPLIGCRLGRIQGIQQLGDVGDIMCRSATVGQALADLTHLFHLHNQGATVDLHVSDRTAQLSFQILESEYAGTRQQEDLAATVGIISMRLLCGECWRPDGVHLAHNGHGDQSNYAAVFRSPVRFNAQQICITFPAVDLQQPTGARDQDVYQLMRQRLGYQAQQQSLGLAVTVKKLILRALFNDEQNTIESVADYLYIDKRTLQRKLAKENLKYQSLLEATRFDLARKYLTKSAFSLTQIAELLSYSDLSSFSRAFKKNAGCSPTQWRTRQLESIE